MRNFIFLTQEGFTRTPENEDIENLQVLGIASGENENQAFENLIKENIYLLDTNYCDVIALELKNEKSYRFYLNEFLTVEK